MSAADAVVGGRVADPSLPWLMTIARNKLIDHWRRQSREDRSLRAVAEVPSPVEHPSTSALDEPRALEVLRALAEPHRSALTLRYVDGLSVPEIAGLLGRTVHATEALLVRARATFRRNYGGGES